MKRTRKRVGHKPKQFWEAQAGLCDARANIYRTAARNCQLSFMGYRPFEGGALYCQMQAASCDMQKQFCRILAALLG